jgi:HEAT repeat protein
VLLALAAVASDATAGDGNAAPDRLANDLICRFGSWDGCDGWFSANRCTMLGLSYRATPAPRQTDAAARDRARDALDAALSSKDGFVASEAALALGLAGDPRDAAALARVVADRSASFRMRRWAALALGLLPPGDATQSAAALDALLGALAAGKEETYQEFWGTSAYALALKGDKTVVPRLVELRKRMLAASLNARGLPVPGEATGALTYAIAALGGADALGDVEGYLRGKQQPEAVDSMWSAVHALVRVTGDGSVRLLRGLTNDERQPVRCVAMQALGVAAGPKDDDSAKILRDCLANEREVTCRQMAAIGLARSCNPTAGPDLATALERGPGSDKRFVGMALGIWLRGSPDPKLATTLVRTFEKAATPDDRAGLAIAIGMAGAKDGLKAIVEAIPKGRGGPVTSGCCCALGLLGAGPAEVKLLHEILDASNDPCSRREAAMALGLAHDKTVVAQLRAILQSKRHDLDRATCAICLGRVGDDADIDFLVGVMADRATSEPLRACVVRGLGLLLDRSEGARIGGVVANGRWTWRVQGADPFGDLRYLME